MKNKCCLLIFKLVTQKQKQSNTATVVDSYSIRQELQTGYEPNAVSTASNITGLTEYPELEHETGVSDQIGYPYKAYYLTGDHATITVKYSNLQNWSYQGKKISNVIYQLSLEPNLSSTAARNAYIVNGQYTGGLVGSKACFMFGNDPTKGFQFYGVKAHVIFTAYYEDGTPVNFEKGTAYFSVGSLNNYMNRLTDQYNDTNQYSTEGSSIEATQVINGGQAVGLTGSSVTAHEGGWLYADSPNTVTDGSVQSNAHDTFSSTKHYDGHYGDWDRNNSGSQYVGAGLIRLSGSQLELNVGTIDNGIDPSATYRNWMWWNTSAVIPKTPAVEVHYHYDVNDKCKEKPNGVTTYQSESK